jgi:hypothetical protein
VPLESADEADMLLMVVALAEVSVMLPTPVSPAVSSAVPLAELSDEVSPPHATPTTNVHPTHHFKLVLVIMARPSYMARPRRESSRLRVGLTRRALVADLVAGALELEP